MHGEYKPPGGKLVAADVEVSGGRLARVQISGDFFLEPDGALERVKAALAGIPATVDAPVMTARISGGAMFVDPASTITYSLYAPESLVAGMSYTKSYGYLDDRVIGALAEDLGVSAWYQPLNDIASARGKIDGAAQKRLAGGAVLHHVTMAYDIDADAMTRVLRIGREKLSGRGIPSVVKRVDPLCRQTRLSRGEIIDALSGYFRRRYGLTPDTVTVGELHAARDLARDKFASSEWTARVP